MINRDYIKENFLNTNGGILNKYIKTLNDDEIQWFKSLYDDSESLEESIVRYIYNIDIRPTCKICGNKLKFSNTSNVFNTFCSRACINRDPESKKKQLDTKRKNYLEKCKELNKVPHEVKHIERINGLIIKSQRKLVKENKWGGISGGEISRIRSVKKWKELGHEIEYTDDDLIIMKNGCKYHGDIFFTKSLFNNRMKPERRNVMCICPICNPPKSSISTQEIIIKNILDAANVSYRFHDHKQIHPKELDFYLPDYRIGIECNGMYWHSINWQQIYNHDLEKSHFDKRKICEEKGIKLLTFWENDVNHKEEQIKSQIIRILNLSDNINPERIERGTKTQCKNFIEENSLYKYIDLSGDNFLIYCEDEIVGEFSIVADTIVHFVEKNNISLNKYFIFKFIKEEFPNVKYFNINLDYDIYDRWKNWFIVKEEYLDSFYYNRLTSMYCEENNEDKTNIYKCFTSGTLKLEFK